MPTVASGYIEERNGGCVVGTRISLVSVVYLFVDAKSPD
jgi:hypothetical protein